MKIKITDDKVLSEKIKQKLVENNGYCPCRLEKTEDTKCMCREFLDMKEGVCHCGLYVKISE